MNDEYNSQLVQKALTWVFQKWRRTTKNASSSTPSVHEQQPPEEPEYTHNRHSVHRQRVHKWAILDDEFENWSTNVKEFYLNRDASFCYIGVFNTPLQLDRNFGEQFWPNSNTHHCLLHPIPQCLESLQECLLAGLQEGLPSGLQTGLQAKAGCLPHY
ncbi:hypothetical protein E3N88_11819 [Mikania micrantha]|uniref:Uncharacterized protein n=1 Tax=Mikania micrantha TaxID=192012 RepID=A0A5N6P3S4_9ASTR|nr:hypothetical protein E3N88_11819 [Mikania micrantha]